jgi:hydroxymethylglutaryl-CoA synthase
MTAGIDAIAFSIPLLYLPIPELAVHRNIAPEKLTQGLGLHRMSLLDVYQDVVTLASNAAWNLLKQENIKPEDIDRIYVGTESGVDSSKPVASYVISNLEQLYGMGSFRRCDVVDMTFACIGAMDALQNCLDFIRANPDKKAIVIASDMAKYDLESTGEYTQGAGALAMLISSNPSILEFSTNIGVSTEGVFDFFKPRRYVSKSVLAIDASEDWYGVKESVISIYKEQPVFDGQYSNECYINRIADAYSHFTEVAGYTYDAYSQWAAILMHLPYCYQGRRTFIEIFAEANPTLLESQPGESRKDKMKALAKSPEYLALVEEKIMPSEIASGQVGNIYTGSLFLGLLSSLSYHARQSNDLAGNKIGFIGYGSGSKSKVMEAKVMPGWRQKISACQLFETLEKATPVTFEQYEDLHTCRQKTSIQNPQNEFYLSSIEETNPVLLGARYYKVL